MEIPQATPPTPTARSASNAKVGTTVFHVPGDADLNLRANDATSYAKWPFLYPNAKDTNGDGTIAGDEIGAPLGYRENDTDTTYSVWTLPDCEPGVSRSPAPTTCASAFPRRLLRTSDWESVNYRFETFREPGLAVKDRGYAFVFYRPGTVPAGKPQPIWTTNDPDSNEIDIEVGTISILSGLSPVREPTSSRFTPKGFPSRATP